MNRYSLYYKNLKNPDFTRHESKDQIDSLIVLREESRRISERLYHALDLLQIDSAEKLSSLSQEDLLRIPNFGRKSLDIFLRNREYLVNIVKEFETTNSFSNLDSASNTLNDNKDKSRKLDENQIKNLDNKDLKTHKTSIGNNAPVKLVNINSFDIIDDIEHVFNLMEIMNF